MERLSRLVRPPERAFRQVPISNQPIVSVLDLGTVAVKAMVLSIAGERPALLAYAREPRAADADDAGILAAAERALVRAEDAAGELPRRVVIAVPASECVFASSAKAARLAISAERGEAPPLTELRQSGFATAVSVDRARRLATALDLDLAGVIAEPDAQARLSPGSGPAIMVDVGGATTGLALCDADGVVASISVPVGGASLVERMCERLGLIASEAAEAVIAYSAGAGHRSGAGLSAARTIAELARHHTDVWLDAIETGLSELARGHPLPASLQMCGGGALLPDVQDALGGGAWHAALPFRAMPTVHVLRPGDVKGLDLPRDVVLGTDSVPALCLAVATAHPQPPISG
ncbi:MAG: hypothetical protein ACR2NO_01360 [Chloroflexota bacterium]